MFGWEDMLHVLLLRDYNTRLVVLSTAVLGAAGGLVGTFLLLRKRALMGDVLAHATLPGIALAFMALVAMGGDGKALPGLLAGATVFGLLGFAAVMFITRWTRLKSDAAMGIVLSVFFGFGAALLGMVQDMPAGSAAGLESFIYGKTASMIYRDFVLIVGVAGAAGLACALLFKELKLLCFDDAYASSQGYPAALLDAMMLMMVISVVVIGLQAVGLILVIALLIVPAAAARFWTHTLWKMLLIAALIGLLSGWIGASASALAQNMPAGAVIVVAAAVIFVVSVLVGPARGVAVRAVGQIAFQRRIRHQHLLRAFYEAAESSGDSQASVSFEQLMRERSWTRLSLRRLLHRARRAGLAQPAVEDRHRLTAAGQREAARIVRNHRLWEMYLITHADIAPSHVDRDADMIEHVLSPEMVAKLEGLLAAQTAAEPKVPVSPHVLQSQSR